MDSEKELTYFREEWQKEIKLAKIILDKTDKGAHLKAQRVQHLVLKEKQDLGTQSCSIPNKRNVKTNDQFSDPTLDGGNECQRHCSEAYQKHEPLKRHMEQKTHKSKDIAKRLRHDFTDERCNFTENSPKVKNSSDAENLLDVLIHDIDEVVGLPFFDMELPKEIAVRIFSSLSLADLGRCALVNSKWKLLSEIDLIWFKQCKKLKIDPEFSCVTKRQDWKMFVRDSLAKEKTLYLNWKEKLCQVNELEYEKGGILCCAAVLGSHIVSGYKNGIVKLWNTIDNSFTRELKDDVEPDVNQCPVKATAINDEIIAAGYTGGKVNIWKGFKLTHQLNTRIEVCHVVVGPGAMPAVCIVFNQSFQLHVMQRNREWSQVLEKNMNERILDIAIIDSEVKWSGEASVLVLSRCRLTSYSCGGVEKEYEYFETGAQLSCMILSGNKIFCGISPLGYSIFDGYMIRSYDSHTGKMIASISGSQFVLYIMHVSTTDLIDKVVVGCSDYNVRLHKMLEDSQAKKYTGLGCCPTAIQADEWKIVAGGSNGTICVWNQNYRSPLWTANLRHRTELVHFTKSLLITVHVPVNSPAYNDDMRYADDLIEHRRNRGVIRLYDFSADLSTKGVQEICKSTFDDTSGYNYNIELITPYDAIESV